MYSLKKTGMNLDLSWSSWGALIHGVVLDIDDFPVVLRFLGKCLQWWTWLSRPSAGHQSLWFCNLNYTTITTSFLEFPVKERSLLVVLFGVPGLKNVNCILESQWKSEFVLQISGQMLAGRRSWRSSSLPQRELILEVRMLVFRSGVLRQVFTPAWSRYNIAHVWEFLFCICYRVRLCSSVLLWWVHKGRNSTVRRLSKYT